MVSAPQASAEEKYWAARADEHAMNAVAGLNPDRIQASALTSIACSFMALLARADRRDHQEYCRNTLVEELLDPDWEGDDHADKR